MGGTALLLCELARPGTFDALLLFEPIVFPTPSHPLPDGFFDKSPLALAAARRRPRFEAADPDGGEAAMRAQLKDRFRRASAFARWREDALDAYVSHGFRILTTGTRGAAGPSRRVEGAEVRCPPWLEASVYRSDLSRLGLWERLADVKCPVTVVRGSLSAHMDALTAMLPDGPGDGSTRFFFETLAAAVPAPIVCLEGAGHFAPMEQPEAAAQLVLESVRALEGRATSRL
jgi:pimeloyl-ACP methyl ester carboxylesterase